MIILPVESRITAWSLVYSTVPPSLHSSDTLSRLHDSSECVRMPFSSIFDPSRVTSSRLPTVGPVSTFPLAT